MKQILICLSLVFLFSCQKGNKDPETFIVVKIHEDSVGVDGFKYRTVVIKNSPIKYRKFSGRDSLKIGDTVMVGRNEIGEYFVTGDNLKNFVIRPMSKDSI